MTDPADIAQELTRRIKSFKAGTGENGLYFRARKLAEFMVYHEGVIVVGRLKGKTVGAALERKATTSVAEINFVKPALLAALRSIPSTTDTNAIATDGLAERLATQLERRRNGDMKWQDSSEIMRSYMLTDGEVEAILAALRPSTPDATAITKAMEALAPFAAEANNFDDRKGRINYSYRPIADNIKLKIGDLRRARKALAALRNGEAS